MSAGAVVLAYCYIVAGALAINSPVSSAGGSNKRDGVVNFATVTPAGGDGPASTLFASCLSATRTVEALEATFASVEVGDDVEFQRHVPKRAYSGDWQSVAGAESFFDCAAAAGEAGDTCFMFKYGDTGCMLQFNKSYDLSAQPGCPVDESEAVFVRTPVSDPCPLPAAVFYVDDLFSYCLRVVELPVTGLSYINQATVCMNGLTKTNQGFGDSQIAPSFANAFMSVADTQQFLSDMGYEQDVAVMMKWDDTSSPPAWKWQTNSFELPLPASAFSAGMPDGGTGDDDFQAVYMKADDGFLFHAANMTDSIPSVLCLHIAD